jgi:CubicO group peptidase (beta-lactamase class C family)
VGVLQFRLPVLGLILERAEHAAFSEPLKRRVFRPLAMTCSGVAGDGGGRPVQGHARGNPVQAWTHRLCGAGGVESTPQDLARYLVACLTHQSPLSAGPSASPSGPVRVGRRGDRHGPRNRPDPHRHQRRPAPHRRGRHRRQRQPLPGRVCAQAASRALRSHSAKPLPVGGGFAVDAWHLGRWAGRTSMRTAKS